jgi:hypothetical protein
MVRGHNSSNRIKIPVSYTRPVIPADRSNIPTQEIAKKWPHLEPIADELLELQDSEIGLLIGYDCTKALTPTAVIPALKDEPYAQKTDLGWSIIGRASTPTQLDDEEYCTNRMERLKGVGIISFRTHVKEVMSPQQIGELLEMDFKEETEDIMMSVNDRIFMGIMQNRIKHLPDRHFELPLPFKGKFCVLPYNKIVAERRLAGLEKRMSRDEKFKQDYSAFMKDMIQKGYAEPVPVEELNGREGRVWYLPHHGVYHPTKKKIRVVFDCSAEHKGETLNKHLLQGPDFMNNLTGILCRFRKEIVAITCDIEGMFLQVKVDPEYRDYLRFLWYDEDKNPIEYRMTVHLFGATSSPGCSNHTLKETAKRFEWKYGRKASEFIENEFYVDDGLTSVIGVTDAIQLVKDSKNLCAEGGFNLQKFISSHVEVIESIPLEDRAKGVKNLNFEEHLPVEPALGVHWNVNEDTFQYKVELKDKPDTRRGILSNVASIFDPLGLVAPVILKGKQILQELCKGQIDWDREIPCDIHEKWKKWKNDVLGLRNLQIPRCFKANLSKNIVKKELHYFSDASDDGYGQCTYLRLIDVDGNVQTSLVIAKSRVTPLKLMTIPRLELNAACVSVRIAEVLRRELKYEDIEEYFWTDSKVVLGYIFNEVKRFKTFVANRVAQIRRKTSTNQWHYISTKDNPADIASRGSSATQLLNLDLWWHGPTFLKSAEVPSEEKFEVAEVKADDPEVRSLRTVAYTQDCYLLEKIRDISSWSKAVRITAYCLKFKDVLQGQRTAALMVEDIRKAERLIIKMVQKESFPEEIEAMKIADDGMAEVKISSPLNELDPFIDEEGVLRVGGRLRRSQLRKELKHPIILPKEHHITKLLIQHFHQRVEHQGRGMTINEIRSNGFWILGCRSVVGHIIQKCVTCRKLRARLQIQKMADLPEDRLEPQPPFTYCGVDLFAPFTVKEGRKELKRYGVLFTCLASRAVHIEVANALTTDSFINALRRFISIRGQIRILRCDQGTNFVGAKNEFSEALKR